MAVVYPLLNLIRFADQRKVPNLPFAQAEKHKVEEFYGQALEKFSPGGTNEDVERHQLCQAVVDAMQHPARNKKPYWENLKHPLILVSNVLNPQLHDTEPWNTPGVAQALDFVCGKFFMASNDETAILQRIKQEYLRNKEDIGSEEEESESEDELDELDEASPAIEFLRGPALDAHELRKTQYTAKFNLQMMSYRTKQGFFFKPGSSFWLIAQNVVPFQAWSSLPPDPSVNIVKDIATKVSTGFVSQSMAETSIKMAKSQVPKAAPALQSLNTVVSTAESGETMATRKAQIKSNKVSLASFVDPLPGEHKTTMFGQKSEGVTTWDVLNNSEEDGEWWNKTLAEVDLYVGEKQMFENFIVKGELELVFQNRSNARHALAAKYLHKVVNPTRRTTQSKQLGNTILKICWLKKFNSRKGQNVAVLDDEKLVFLSPKLHQHLYSAQNPGFTFVERKRGSVVSSVLRNGTWLISIGLVQPFF